jgi:hypothetical protein
MNKKMKIRVVRKLQVQNKSVILGLLLFLGCQQPENGISPIRAIPEIPQKLLMGFNTPVSVICHFDVDNYNPLNVLDYFFEARPDQTPPIPEIPLFDYVVLGYAYLVKDSGDYVLIQPAKGLQHILDNNKTYLKPLREKGLKILMEVRSGNYTDSEEGAGFGLGTLDMAGVEQLIIEFKLLANRYGIDGFELNDTGGGYKAYPPYTRHIKQFQSNKSMYDYLFVDKDGNPLSLTDEQVEAILWREGGSNLANLTYKLNETLKLFSNVAADFGSVVNDNQVVETRRRPLVRDSGHGAWLIADIRYEYMPDAYSGATGSVADNMRYLIHAAVNDDTQLHPMFYDEVNKENVGVYADDRYGPFVIDMANRLNAADARSLAQWYRGTGAFGPPKRYGAVYFSNLQSVTEAGSESTLRAYMTYFTQELFGRTTRLREGGGDYQKTW